jgi:PKD repeat protein
MAFTYIRRAALALALIATASCTVKTTEPPPLSGPSGLALLLSLNAVPDSISQDGGSQSSIRVSAIGPDGKPVSALPLRMDMLVNGVAQDYGTLSARAIVTNGDGVASVVYTAPASPPNGVFGTCGSLPGNCVSIVATATATNFATANPQQVQIRLVPQGVILPPTSAPAPSFVVVPGSPAANSPAQFDASTSCGGPLVSGSCPASAPSITSYSWNFGDGQAGTGQTVSHAFALQQTYTVTLTVTNALGASASKPQVLTVGGGSPPNPSFTFSPAAPAVGELIFFNALASTAGQGHTIASYRWNFGDGTSGSGSNVSHAFTTAGAYTVQLTVTDDAGVSVTSAGTTVTAGAPPTPTANFTFSPLTPIVNQSVVFDWRTSTTAQGQTIVSLDWNFGDSTPIVHCPGDAACTSDGITTHAFPLVGTFAVNLVVKDSAGRTGVKSATVTVSSGNPVPVITFSPSSPKVAGTVNFDSAGTTTSGGATIATYLWTFPSGVPASSASASPSVTWAAAGTYTVRLTVTDSQNRVGSTTVQVVVVP